MPRRTALRSGGVTDAGAVRPDNEDNLLIRDDLGLWAVADGMSGHLGGEVASEVACEVLGQAFVERTTTGLTGAIEQANAKIHELGGNDPELSGMGTTIAAVAVIEDGGTQETLAVANVGDSRVYRLANGHLEQLTQDHSLVGELVRNGYLSPEEAAVHPRRNIVTRVLGVDDEVTVDVLTVEPCSGDRFVLCSDGLFNEIGEPDIAAVLGRIDAAPEAAAELVRLAKEAGGRDNVTVVVVDVGDDAQATDPPAGATPEGRASTGESGDPEPTGRADGGGRGRHLRRPGRRITWRVVVAVVALVALVGGAFAAIEWYGRSSYFVSLDEDGVAIYKGRPGGVLWVDPERVDVADLDRERVPADRVGDLETGVEQASLGEARHYVARLRDRADEPDGTGRSATTQRPTSTTASTAVTSTTAPAPRTTAAR